MNSPYNNKTSNHPNLTNSCNYSNSSRKTCWSKANNNKGAWDYKCPASVPIQTTSVPPLCQSTKFKFKYMWIVRIFLLILIPVLAFSLAVIFNVTKDGSEPPQHLEFAIPIVLFAFAVLAWAFYLFVWLNILIFSEFQWKQRSKDDSDSKYITISAVFEILILTLYGLILLGYAVYLFDNEQYVDTLQTRSAFLVDIGTSHLWILFIFIHYTTFGAFGAGVVFHSGVKLCSMILAILNVLWFVAMNVTIFASVNAIMGERREKARSGEDV